MKIHEVLVPLDLGEQSDRALPVARAVADQLGALLGAVVVSDAGLDPELDDREARLHARRAGCGLDRVVLRTDDDVAAGILAAAPSPGTLLCLATHARGAAAGLVLGAVGEEVLCRATAPVLAVGPAVPDRPPVPVQRIVCCVGGEQEDERLVDRLLDTAADWAGALGCETHLVRVVVPGSGARHLLDERERLDAIAQRLWARGDLATSALVADHHTSAGIVRALGRREGTLGLMASHARTGWGMRTLGHVALDVLRHAPVPVLVVPSHAATADPPAVRRLATAAG